MSIVTVDDAAALGYCATGMRAFCLRYNLNYIDFVRNGIEGQRLLELTNFDHQAVKIVEKANERRI